MNTGYRPTPPDLDPYLVGDPAAEDTLGKLGTRFKGAGFTLLVSADSVTIVLSGRSGFRSAGGGDD